MKYVLILMVYLFCQSFAFAQNEEPTTITPQILEKIKADIEKEVPLFKQHISKLGFTTNQAEFSIDTFRIEQMVSKRMNIDYSASGIKTNVEEMTASYDNLMNKYYDKLLNVLKPEDKQTLVSAQQNWLKYRDAEFKLIWLMTKDAYADGGTMQSNMATGACSNMVVQRAIDVFNYFDYIIKDK